MKFVLDAIREHWPGFCKLIWQERMLGLLFGILLLAIFWRLRRLLGYEVARKEDIEPAPSHLNAWQCGFVACLALILFLFVFQKDIDYFMSSVALILTFFALLDKTILWTTHRASQHASAANESARSASVAASQAGQLTDATRKSVESAADKVDVLRDKTTELVENVMKMRGVDAVSSMQEIVKRLTLVLDNVKDGKQTLLLAATPAIGLSGAGSETTMYADLADSLCKSSRKLGDALKIVCYDVLGRDQFYRDDQKITDKELLNRYALLTVHLMDGLALTGTLPHCVGRHSERGKSKPLLDGVHFLIVNWEAKPGSDCEAVIWHLDAEVGPNEKIKGAGFWTSNHDIILTFSDVFHGVYSA